MSIDLAGVIFFTSLPDLGYDDVTNPPRSALQKFSLPQFRDQPAGIIIASRDSGLAETSTNSSHIQPTGTAFPLALENEIPCSREL